MDSDKLLNLATSLGCLLAESGAEISRVEESVYRLLQAYQGKDAQVFAIPSLSRIHISKEAETISGRKRGVFMNAKKCSDALSALDGRYVEEAARYRRKHGQSFWVRWGAAAACLCLLAAGGALLIQGRGRAAPDPQQVQIPNPILTVASAAEMEAYLDFKVPVLEKEVEAYSVFISDGYPTMGQVD